MAKKTDKVTTNGVGVEVITPTETQSIEVAAKTMQVALKPVAKFARPTSSYTLSIVLLDVTAGNEVWLHAYDGASYIRYRLNAQVYPPNQPWQLVVPIKLFHELINSAEATATIRLMPDLVKQELYVHLGGEANRSKIKCFDSGYFPIQGEYSQFIHQRTLSSSIFLGCLSRLIPTIGREASKPTMQHVLVNEKWMVSTNGYALGIANHPFGEMVEGKPFVLLAIDLVESAKDVLGDHEQFTIGFDAGAVATLIQTPDMSLVVPTMSERFPAYEAVIPEGFQTTFRFDVEPLRRGIRSAVTLDLANDVARDSTGVQFTLTEPENGQANLHVSNTMRSGPGGDFDCDLPVSILTGSPLTGPVSFNLAASLLDGILKSVGVPSITCGYNSAKMPIGLQEDDVAQWLIVPRALPR